MTAISDRCDYNNSLRTTIDDKAWFFRQMPEHVSAWGDWGCGDGSLLASLMEFWRGLLPGVSCCGYDTDPLQAQLANERGIQATSKRAAFEAFLHDTRGTKGLILSSVLHEMSLSEWDDVFFTAWRCGVEYIVVRDMSQPPTPNAYDPTRRPSLVRDALDDEERGRLREFEDHSGPIDLKHNLLHFFLKYRYVANWKRELAEQYLVPFSHVCSVALNSGFKPIHVEHYRLPWLADHVRSRFGFELDQMTHVKMILKRFPT